MFLPKCEKLAETQKKTYTHTLTHTHIYTHTHTHIHTLTYTHTHWLRDELFMVHGSWGLPFDFWQNVCAENFLMSLMDDRVSPP